MRKETAKKIIRDRYVIVSVFVGVTLMALTLYFRVNPVEGGVVDELISRTPFHYVLLITTMPAWIAGVVIGIVFDPLIYPLIFIIQIALYAAFGLLLRKIHTLLFRKHT